MRSINDPSKADHFTKIIATDLFKPLANSSRDNKKEFKEILARLLRDSIAEMEPLDLFDFLAKQETIDDNALKNLNRAWLNLTKEQQNNEMKSLFNKIAEKPRKP